MKGATCRFCGKSFRNQQAVRAHLKHCPAYRHLPKAALPSIGSKPTSGLRDRDRSSRLNSAPRPAAGRPAHARPRIAPDLSHEPHQKELRRVKIQSLKDQVIGSWWSLGHTIPSETKSQALVAIEQELSRLPVDQLPRSELVAIAEGIRDQIYKPVLQAQQRAREEEERRRHHARQKTNLVAFGGTHANQTLRQQEDLDGWTRLDLEQKVKQALEQDLDGSESEADIKAWVDDFLARHREPAEAKQQKQARQRLIAYGVAYVRRELASEEDLDPRERIAIERDVKQDLEEAVTGKESERDVEAFVDGVLEQMIGEPEEEADEEAWDNEDEADEEDNEDEEYEEDEEE